MQWTVYKRSNTLLKSQLERLKATIGSSQGKILIGVNLPIEKSSGNGRVNFFYWLLEILKKKLRQFIFN